MATMPPQDPMAGEPSQPPMGDPAAQPPEQTDEMANGYCIELRVKPDGSITVSSEPLAQEMAEEPGAEEGGGEGTPAENIKEALTIALQIYKNKGKPMADAGMGDEDFTAGYANRGGSSPKGM